MPSNKRQRITVSAMQRLFASFTLNETDPTPAAHINTLASGDTKTITISADNNSTKPTPRISNNVFQTPAVIQNLKLEQQSRCKNHTSQSSTNNNNNNAKNTPNRNNPEKKNHFQNTNNEEKDISTTSTANLSVGKRQADQSDNDEPAVEASSPKSKKTRTLKRGLRLCSSITCYIEQVIYS